MVLDFQFLTSDVLRSYVWQGLVFSVQLTLAATAGGLLLGTWLAVARLSSRRWLSWPAAAYINLMRSVPLVLVLLWFFLLIPFAIGRPLGAEWSAVITFTLFEAAYFAEIVRAGIQSVPAGQKQAAMALGMSGPQSMRLVILPQALRNMLPVLFTQAIILFQDTSLVYAIGAYDLLKGFESVGRNFNRPMETYLVAAGVYFLICFSLSMAVRRLQARIAIRR